MVTKAEKLNQKITLLKNIGSVILIVLGLIWAAFQFIDEIEEKSKKIDIIQDSTKIIQQQYAVVINKLDKIDEAIKEITVKQDSLNSKLIRLANITKNHMAKDAQNTQQIIDLFTKFKDLTQKKSGSTPYADL